MGKAIRVRKYRASDREAVRWLCCETGYLGKPIDSVFEDRELFADYLTSYYTDVEPESCFVLELDGQVRGYLLGSRRPALHQWFSIFMNLSLAFRALVRYRKYGRATREFIGWILRNSWREVPAAPRRTAHFHFNVLPEAQSVAGTRAMIEQYFEYLRSHGEKAVFGQLVTFESRRGAKLFEKYGFHVLDRRRLTKWENKHSEPVYLTTVVKSFREEAGSRL